MGGGIGSSSKRKSSKKKIDESYSKKRKSKRKESKKRHRKDDSVSSYSDDDSFNSKCSSSSTSETDYRRTFNKSKKRRRDYSVSSCTESTDDCSMSSDTDYLSRYDDVRKSKKLRTSKYGSKNTKKKVKKRYTSPKRNTDEKRVRKRKRNRNRLSKDPAVKGKKKSSKKKSLSSSSSFGSQSCSTCPSRSSSASTSDGKSHKNRTMRNKEIKILIGKGTHRKRKVMSPSCSSCSRGGEQSVSVGHSDGTSAPVINSRRLKSVITIVTQPDKEDDRWENDPHIEEAVYKLDNCESSRDPDKNGSTREIDIDSLDVASKKMRVEHVSDKETELGKSRIHSGHQNNAGDRHDGGAHTNDLEKDKNTDLLVPVAPLSGDNLESILRQKALENLRKFRGGVQTASKCVTDVKMNYDNDVKGSSTGCDDNILNNLTSQGSLDTQQLNQKSEIIYDKDFSRLTEAKKHSLQNCASPNASRSDTDAVAGAANICNLSTAEPPSCSKPIAGEQNLEEQQNETKEGSEFEQKTMMVLRGGEMVQVTYKVKIPKRAPALSRRQLGR